jgi:hypothetical protein
VWAGSGNYTTRPNVQAKKSDNSQFMGKIISNQTLITAEKIKFDRKWYEDLLAKKPEWKLDDKHPYRHP